MVKVSPSLLTADFCYIGDTIKMLDKAGADWIHCDVMDNIFVPSMSFGQYMIKSIRKITQKPLDVHLMVHDAASYLGEFAEAGADIMTVHPESPSNTHLHRIVSRIRSLGKKAGVALNPTTHPDVLEYLWDDIDLVLVMSVNPGFGVIFRMALIMYCPKDILGTKTLSITSQCIQSAPALSSIFTVSPI